MLGGVVGDEARSLTGGWREAAGGQVLGLPKDWHLHWLNLSEVPNPSCMMGLNRAQSSSLRTLPGEDENISLISCHPCAEPGI